MTFTDYKRIYDKKVASLPCSDVMNSTFWREYNKLAPRLTKYEFDNIIKTLETGKFQISEDFWDDYSGERIYEKDYRFI